MMHDERVSETGTTTQRASREAYQIWSKTATV